MPTATLSRRPGAAPATAEPDPASGTHPTRREQTMLARQARQGDARSREAMILRNQRLAQAIAQQYAGRGLDLEDLVQEGMVGLVKAVDRFDPERGVAFSTYATYWIHQSIQRALDNGARLIRIPAHLGPAVSAIRRAASELSGGTAGLADPGAIAEATGIDPDTCSALLQATAVPASVHAPVRADGNTLLEDFLADPAAPDPEAEAAREEVRERVHRLLDLLPARERAVIRARFGFDGPPETLERIAARYRLSHERIRQIQVKALARLKRAGQLLRLDVMARESELL
jgi:RNA polymerase sigma factor (sigma-70 family)